MLDVFEPLPVGAGPIGLLSGDEFTAVVADFDRVVLDGRPIVAILPAADPDNAGTIMAGARAHLEPLGKTVTSDLGAADAIYLPGGDPRVLLASVDERTWDAVLVRWRAGTALVGSSAGAMALCEHCLVPEPGARAPTRWVRGLGPVRGVGLAVHATTRPDGWLHEVTGTSHFPVVAIDDGTGIVLAERNDPDIIGRGRAWVCS